MKDYLRYYCRLIKKIQLLYSKTIKIYQASDFMHSTYFGHDVSARTTLPPDTP